MATKLFLRNTTTNGITDSGDTIVYDMLIAAGSAVDTDIVTLTAGGSNIQWTQSAGGSSVAWISGRVPAGGFTLTTSDFSAWFRESNNNDNAGGRIRIYRYQPGGTVTELGGGPFDDGVEWTTTIAEYTWTANVTDQAFSENDRILVRVFANNVGSMTAGTADIQFNAADAATGDSFYNINENVTFKAENPTPLSVSVVDYVFVIESGLGTMTANAISQDTFYGTSFLTGPNGSATELHVGGFGDHYYPYLQFDLTGLPAQLATAKLVLSSTSANSTSPLPQIFRMTQSWSAATLSLSAGGSSDASTPTHDSTAYQFLPAYANVSGNKQVADLSVIANLWASGTSNFGIVMIDTVNSPNSDVMFASVDHATTALRPILYTAPVVTVSIVANPTPSVSDTVTVTDVPTILIPTLRVSVSDKIYVETLLFGTDSVGTNQWGAAVATEARVTKFTSPGTTGTIVGIEFWGNCDSGTIVVGASLYSDNTDVPNARLVGDTGNATVGTTASWNFIPLTPYTFAATTKYWLGIFGGGASILRLFYETGGTNQSNYASSLTFETWPDPWPAGTFQNRNFSVFARYYEGNNFVALSIPLNISVSDTVTVTENTSQSVINNVSVNDTVTVTDVPTIVIPTLVPSVSDTVTITENISLSIPLPVSTFDWVYAVESKLDQATDSNNVQAIQGGTAGAGETTQAIGQSFVATGNSISVIDLKLFKTGTPTDNLLVDLVSSLGGASLGNVTIAASSVSSGAVRTFTFASPVAVTSGTTYYIQVTRDGARDTSNYIQAYYSTTSVYSGGAMQERNNNSWTAAVGDLRFGVTYASGLQILSISFLPSVNDLVTVTENISLSIPLPISVSDLVTVTENVSLIIPTLFPSVSDTVTITENISLSIPLPVSVYDLVTITENISLSIPLPVFVFDSVTITEDVDINYSLPSGGLFDTVTITENISLSIPLPVSVNDTVTVTEDVVTRVTVSISVSDQVTVTENIALTINTPVGDYSVSVFDNITVTEFIGYDPEEILVGEVIIVTILVTPSVFDQVTVTEDVVITISAPGALVISVFDSITVTENIVLSVPLPVSVNDLVTVSENISLSIPLPVSVFDAVTITENIVLSIPLPVSVNDLVTVTENIVLSIPLPISVNDLITVTDVISLYIPTLHLSVNDVVTVTEDVVTRITVSISVSDTVTVTESVVLNIPVLISVSDLVTLTENIVLSIPLPVFVSDTVTVTENITFSIPLPVSVSDTVTLTESVTIFIPVLYISVVETISVDEFFITSGQNAFSVFDAITVTDVISLYIPTLHISVNDVVTVTENIVLSIPLPISVNDLVTITENFQSNVVSYIFVNDVVTVTESVSLSVPLPVSVSDLVTVTDVISLYIPTLYLSVFDEVTITETFTTSGTQAIFVFETITVTEAVTVLIPTVYLSVFDSVTVTEAVTITIPVTISVSDTVTVTENLGQYTPVLYISVSDTITVTEDISISTGVTVFDLVTVSEDVNLYIPVLFLSVFDTVTITEDVVISAASIFVFDTVTVSEEVTIRIPVIYLSVSENVTITESTTTSPSTDGSISDTITVTENVTLAIQVRISVFDSITITENRTVTVVFGILIFDTVTITENFYAILKKYGRDNPGRKPQGTIVTYQGRGSGGSLFQPVGDAFGNSGLGDTDVVGTSYGEGSGY